MASQTCECGSCNCTVDTDSAVEKDGKYYCCEGCANGHDGGGSCSSPDCGCGS